MKIEYVEWVDSSYNGRNGWQDAKEWMTAIDSMICFSIGMVVYEDKESIVLAGHIAPHEKGGEDSANFDVQGAMRIPLTAVQKRLVLLDNKKNNEIKYERQSKGSRDKD